MKVLLVVACSLTLSFGAAVGVNIQKLSMNKEEQKASQQSSKRPPYLQPLWCLGMTIIILDAIGDFVFIGLAPQSLLAPLGSLSLGWNIILAPIFHPDEKVTKDIIRATAIIYIGTLLTVFHASNSTPTYTLQNIVAFMYNRTFIAYFAFIILFQCLVSMHGKKKTGYGIIHYCGLAGSFGGQCILFAKSSSELIKNAFTTNNYHDWTTSPLPYIFILCMVLSVLTQISYLNTGLAKYDALIVVPVYQSFWNAFSITGGLVFFQEYQFMTLYDGMMYSLGIGITLVGVRLLVRQRQMKRLDSSLPIITHFNGEMKEK